MSIKTLKDVRVRQPERVSVAKVFRELLKTLPDDRIPDERTLARLELKPIGEVDRVLAAGYLRVLHTTLEREAPEVAEKARLEADVLLWSGEYAARDSNPEPTVSEPGHPLRRAADLVASAA